MEYTNHKEYMNFLQNSVDQKYREFSSVIVNGKAKFFGIRIPALREKAKQIASDNWQDFFDNENDSSEETITLKGLTIGYAKTDFENFSHYLKKYFALANSWSSCDVPASSFKIIKKYKQETLSIISPFLKSKEEFQCRLALIILLDYFVCDEYIDFVIQTCMSVQNDAYYVKMAIAWLLSVCFVKYPEKTYKLFEQNVLSKWVQNKAIQKCRESFRVSREDKEKLNLLKIK